MLRPVTIPSDKMASWPCDKDQQLDAAVRCELAGLLNNAHVRNVVALVAVVLATALITYLAASVGRVTSIYLVSIFIGPKNLPK